MSNVDTSIHPHATGAAADSVAAHSEPSPLTFYAGWFCPFVQRAWVVLQEKNIPYQYVEINPYKKDPEFLALNPRGLVPTLAINDGVKQRCLYESTVICEFLDEAFADEKMHGPRLLPGPPYERARCRLWMDHTATRIVPAFYRFIQHTAEKPYILSEAREELLGHIKTLVKEMDPTGPWFLGDAFSLVDIMLAPWAKRLFLIEYYKQGGVGIPSAESGDKDATVWARWDVWCDAVRNRQSIKDTWSEDDKYIAVYKRYADDTTQSLVGQATRGGRGLP